MSAKLENGTIHKEMETLSGSALNEELPSPVSTIQPGVPPQPITPAGLVNGTIDPIPLPNPGVAGLGPVVPMPPTPLAFPKTPLSPQPVSAALSPLTPSLVSAVAPQTPAAPPVGAADLTWVAPSSGESESSERRQREYGPRRPRKKNTVNEDILRIIHRMHQHGYKAKEIATITDLTKSTIYKYIDRMDEEKPADDDMSSLIRKRGRKRAENTELQQKIQAILQQDETITLKMMKDKLKEEGHDISISYLSKTIKKMGIKKKTSAPPRKPDDLQADLLAMDTLPPPINPVV